MSKKYYAHSLEGRSAYEWQPLEAHLKNVAEWACSFAKTFGAGDWGYLSGLWHDLGKYSKQFQKMINASCDSSYNEPKHVRVDHSTAGGRHAVEVLPAVGKLLSYTILGHHGGIPNGKSSRGSDLASRLDSGRKIPEVTSANPDLLNKKKKLSLPFPQEKGRIGFQTSFFVRMLFSCLVDADFLDTEQFIDPSRALIRVGQLNLSELKNPLFAKLNEFKPNSPINQKRSEILESCIKAAHKEPGFFSLTVPTGGGKTLSSLAFALRHGITYGKKRIIYVIPFTSIIEQNAKIFRDILGEKAVLEHHSNYVAEGSDELSEETSHKTLRHRLACENWDTTLIVTTNVQFFDSLFANRPSKCRKLHNIANSVIILDEAQMLPETYLRPCLEVLKELTLSYKCTVVLCTATQPALIASEEFPHGLKAGSVTEIISDPYRLFRDFDRVLFNNAGSLDDDQLTMRIVSNNQILCIVNTRRRAADLFQKIKHIPGAFHLSARMCPVHRSEVLEKIREALEDNMPCRVVSTQLIEAGVDVDFPVVYREMAGLDSIAQAAGRCNREGKLDKGRVFVFFPEDGKIPKMFRRAAGAAESVFRRFKEEPFSPDAITDYFRQVFWLAGDELDEKKILADMESGVRNLDFPFKEVAGKFRMIENDMVPVIVPWDQEAKNMIDRLEYTKFPGHILRQLQRYAVQVYENEFKKLFSIGAISMTQQKYPVLTSISPYYSEDIGLCFDQEGFQIEDLVF